MEWMRSVDDRQSDLREMYELTYSRFEARLDQQVSELRGEMQLGFAHVDTSILELRRQVETGIAGLEIRFERRFGELEHRFSDLMKWSFVFWIGSLVTLVGTLAALERFAH